MEGKGKTEEVGALWRKSLEGEEERVAGRQTNGLVAQQMATSPTLFGHH